MQPKRAYAKSVRSLPSRAQSDSAATKPGQRVPEPQDSVDGSDLVSAADPDRTEPDIGDELLDRRLGRAIRAGIEEVHLRSTHHRVREDVPAQAVERSIEMSFWDERAQLVPAVEGCGLKVVGRIDDDLAIEVFRTIAHEIDYLTARHCEKDCLGAAKRIRHRLRALLLRRIAESIGHFVTGLLPHAADCSADVPRANHGNSHEGKYATDA